MNFRSCPGSIVGLCCAAPLVLTVPASAQDEDLGSMANKALAAMNAENWEGALKYHTEAVERFGKNNPLASFGPQFGAIHYRKGICEMKLKMWNEAMRSFEICYRDFPNKEKEGGGNAFEKQALLKWGEAAMGAKDWELAISQFQKFLKERDKALDKYPQGSFHINLAVCYYQLGRIPEGNENLEIAIRNKAGFPTPDGAIIAGFQGLVTCVILERNEQALLDFIAKNRGELVIDPYAMHDYSRVFMKLAGDAIGADMERAAMALYQFVPSTEAASDDVRARLKSIGDLENLKDGSNTLVKGKLEQDLKALEEELRGRNSTEMVRLAAMGILHENHGNLRGAYAAYQQLELYYPNSEKREDNLFNLLRVSSLVAAGSDTRRHAEMFVKTFPNSPHIPAVRRMMLSALFHDGEYATCLEVAEPMIDKLPPNTPEHDICLHVLGASYFYTGQFDKARVLLEKHVEMYPNSLFAIPALYFRASNMSRLRCWSEAAGLLDEFLKTHPDASKNAYLPFALYDRANCHYAEDQPDLGLEKLARITDEFKDSSVLEQAYKLRGDIEQSRGNAGKAEQAYVKALEVAEARRNNSVANEALYSLVALLGGKGPASRMKDAVPYADKFWKEYGGNSPLKTRVAVAQMAALGSVGRGEQALSRLREVIAEVAGNPEATGLEALIHSYTEAYLKNHTPEELKDHYYNFPGVGVNDRATRALFQVAVIGVFENVVKNSTDEARKDSGNAMIKVLIQNLKTDFAVKDLSNFILVRVGDYLRNQTSTPREALPYYDEALGRKDPSYRFAALLGRADVYGRSTNAADLDKGLEDFARVYADSKDPSEREFSLYRMVALNMAKKDFAKAAEHAKIYLDRASSGFSKFSSEVDLMLAKSLEEHEKETGRK